LSTIKLVALSPAMGPFFTDAPLFTGEVDLFAQWIQEQTLAQTHPFEKGVLQAHIEELCEWVVGAQNNAVSSQ